MALSEELKDFKKEHLKERDLIKFQDNVAEIFAQYERAIRALEERIYNLENP